MISCLHFGLKDCIRAESLFSRTDKLKTFSRTDFIVKQALFILYRELVQLNIQSLILMIKYSGYICPNVSLESGVR